ncbi:T6SS immunity protein Tdi1 domain-containing protein [Tundrisphaera lichenicola]|uniref:T6SS immunity protein Tdi1 domain-containing protein n=1 Tax=Tundrisphaera lichenicola TaxID=2029860 RepID=UPI003EBA3963
MRYGKPVACLFSILVVLVGAALLDSTAQGPDGSPQTSEELSWNDLTVNLYDVDFGPLLKDWRWLVDESCRPIAISALGDLFLQGSDGSVYWLDSGAGRLSRVASSPDEFETLKAEPDHKGEWFQPELVAQLKARGMDLDPGFCYGYKVPPILGGKDDASNFEPTDVQVHFEVLGQLYDQSRDSLPVRPIEKGRAE